MLRSLLVVTLAVLASVGTASATAPIPYIERGVDIEYRQVGYLRSGYYDKPDPVGEVCVRSLVCVGPFFPHIEYDFGATGAMVTFEDTNASAGHDPEDADEHGPYVLPSLVARDDVRVCWTGCEVPTPVFANARTNATLSVWALGVERLNYTVRPRFNFEEPDILPEGVGCSFSNYGCDGDHATVWRPEPITRLLP